MRTKVKYTMKKTWKVASLELENKSKIQHVWCQNDVVTDQRLKRSLDTVESNAPHIWGLMEMVLSSTILNHCSFELGYNR